MAERGAEASVVFMTGAPRPVRSNRSKLMTISIRTGILASAAAMALAAGATSAMAQTTTAPSGTDCSAASAANSQACQNQLQQPGMINNNTQTPTVIPQTNSPAVGAQGGSGSLGGGSSGGSVGAQGGSSVGGSSGGGVGGSSSN
jgi:hypothetical protein